MRMPWRRSRLDNKPKEKELRAKELRAKELRAKELRAKERWCYVGRAKIKGGYWWSYWVYLHPTEDEWWFVDKRCGLAYDMGSYRQWTSLYEFEGLTKQYASIVMAVSTKEN